MKLIKIIIVLFLLVSCKNNEEYLVKSIKVKNGWGYTIALNNKIVIKQTVIPTVSKQMSFASEGDALKVGDLVLERIKQNLSPTVTKNDLILLEISI
jgi:CxxC motif-containing protein